MYLFIYSYLKCISDISIPYYFIEMFRFWNSLGLNVGLIFISSFSPFHLINSQLRHYYLREIFPDPTPYPQTKLIILSYTVSGCSLIFHYRINHIVFFFFFFWPSRAACGILVPQPGIKPKSPAVESGSLNYWTTMEIQSHCTLYLCLFGSGQLCSVEYKFYDIIECVNFAWHFIPSSL